MSSLVYGMEPPATLQHNVRRRFRGWADTGSDLQLTHCYLLARREPNKRKSRSSTSSIGSNGSSSSGSIIDHNFIT